MSIGKVAVVLALLSSITLAAEPPRINGPAIYGARPGNPFLYRIPATGDRPIRFEAAGLPDGLALNANTGIITGSTTAAGEHKVTLRASNSSGKSERILRIVIGDKIALTPPMGWNSWYCYLRTVTDEKMRKAADAMISTGLADHGYSYVCIDDCWSMKPDEKSGPLAGEHRDKDGKINANANFPDMKALTDYIHEKGLKAGIYTSPGPLTCAKHVGSYQHEKQDAERFAEWGYDLVKHDWCSYGKIARDKSLPELQKPYKLMGGLLRQQKRDITLNLCQYGMGDVSTWGESVGAQSWRTAGDLGAHKTLYDGLIKDGMMLDAKAKYVHPGSWNDPDYLQVGPLWRGKGIVPCPMTQDEQYTHMSLWCLLAAPLFLGGDITNLDQFTIDLLSNDEAIAVNQDALGQAAHRVAQKGDAHVWVKDLEDGSKAVGLFNTGTTEIPVIAEWTALGLSGERMVRDLWQHKDLGKFADRFSATVRPHGVVMLRISAAEAK